MMKNLSVRKKLIVGFGTLLLLLLLSIGLALQSVNIIGQQVELYGQYTLPNNSNLWSIRRDLVSAQRYFERAFIETSPSTVKSLLAQAENDGNSAIETLATYKANQRNDSNAEQIDNVLALLQQSAVARQQIGKLLENPTDTNRSNGYVVFLNSYAPPFNEATAILSELAQLENTHAAEQRATATRIITQSWIMLVACAVILLVFSLAIGIAIRKSILTPVNEIVSAFESIAKGNMQTQINYESRDEIGYMAKLIRQTNEMQKGIMADIMDKFTRISQGDLQAEVTLNYPGDYDILKQTIMRMVSSLNNTMQTINNAAQQVSSGAQQVSSGAQALASGSTEQASAVEALTVSATKISKQAEDNATNVEIATRFVQEAESGVSTGNTHMIQLKKAMENINDASSQISNITKVIEDIAFQTNILALNAAIEAARAGEAGKGFAVVAQEVRNLAAKSAEAAKQTADLVAHSSETVASGSQITHQTAQILQEVEQKAADANKNITKIKQASADQVSAIEEVKQGLSQVSAVIQTNAATAEENSATSEEMSAQAVALHHEVEKFKLASSVSETSNALPAESASANSTAVLVGGKSEKY